jgi:hypothetical protein
VPERHPLPCDPERDEGRDERLVAVEERAVEVEDRHERGPGHFSFGSTTELRLARPR